MKLTEEWGNTHKNTSLWISIICRHTTLTLTELLNVPSATSDRDSGNGIESEYCVVCWGKEDETGPVERHKHSVWMCCPRHLTTEIETWSEWMNESFKKNRPEWFWKSFSCSHSFVIVLKKISKFKRSVPGFEKKLNEI